MCLEGLNWQKHKGNITFAQDIINAINYAKLYLLKTAAAVWVLEHL